MRLSLSIQPRRALLRASRELYDLNGLSVYAASPPELTIIQQFLNRCLLCITNTILASPPPVFFYIIKTFSTKLSKNALLGLPRFKIVSNLTRAKLHWMQKLWRKQKLECVESVSYFERFIEKRRTLQLTRLLSGKTKELRWLPTVWLSIVTNN